MPQFNIGDVVEIIKGSDYSITTLGSYGVVVEDQGHSVLVNFQYVPSGLLDQYSVDKRHLKVRGPVDKQAVICRKIKAMSERFERRVGHV